MDSLTAAGTVRAKEKNPGSQERKSIWHKSRQLEMSYFHYSASN